jgi:hypothetical protein
MDVTQAVIEAKVGWSSSKRWHLLHDVGMYKATVKRNFFDNDRGKEFDHVAALLREKRQRYTLAELRELAGFFHTAHDDCVVDNPDEYTALQVYISTRKVQASEDAQARLAKLG